MAKTNHNLAYRLGQNIDDMEVCMQLNIDSSHAYKESINEKAIEATYYNNIKDGMESGLSREEATKIAVKGKRESTDLWNKLRKDTYAPKSIG